MTKSNNAVEVRNIKKSFYLPNHKNDSIKRAITQAFKKKDKGGNTFNALNGISFDIEKGDFFGILGRNGSGKSTLLKIIAQIYQPTSGSVKTQGKVVSFIELGVGFKPELSGRENVYLNGALLGFSRKEIDAMYDDIVEFAELEKFMGQKLKNYSSGMKVRLAFSVAIRAKADILILDEVLAVGDAAFQKKCNRYFKTLKNKGKTVVLVTHNMGAVREYCNKAVVIDDGEIKFSGEASEAADVYLNLFNETSKKTEINPNVIAKGVVVSGVNIEQSGKVTNSLDFKKEFSVHIDLKSSNTYKNISFGLYIYDSFDRGVSGVSSKMFPNISLNKGNNTMLFDFQNILSTGDYYINFAIEDSLSKTLLVQKHGVCLFSVKEPDNQSYTRRAIAHPDVGVRVV